MTKKSPLLTVFLLFLISIAATVSACGSDKNTQDVSLSEDNKLIIYTSHKPEIYEPIIKEFEDRSGIWVQIVQGGTNELLEEIADNDGKVSADIIFGGGVDSLVVYSDYFEPYRTSQHDNLDHSYASPDDSYTVFSKLPIVFIYNEKLVISAGTPRSFGELLTYRWKGNIAFADPTASGSAYTALATMIQVLNKDKTDEEIIRAFSDNLAGDICASSGDVIDQVASGKKPIGITLEETALKRINAGAEIGIVYPQDGTSSVPDGSAILKDAAHKANAKLFMEFIVSDDVQRLLEEKLSRRSVRNDITDYESVVEMYYDIDYATSHRDEILSLWNSAAGGQ